MFIKYDSTVVRGECVHQSGVINDTSNTYMLRDMACVRDIALLRNAHCYIDFKEFLKSDLKCNASSIVSSHRLLVQAK